MPEARAAGQEVEGGRPRLQSLRSRLIASHVFVLLLALALVLVISGAYLRRLESAAEIERLKQLAVPLVVEIDVVSGADPELDDSARARQRVFRTLDAQAEEMELRLLLFEPDAMVVFDSAKEESLVGQRLAAYAGSIRRVAEAGRRGTKVDRTQARVSGEGDDPFDGERVVVAAGGRAGSDLVLGIVAPPRRYPLIGLFLPRLLLVAGISLIVASVAGYVLSRRIATPVNRLAAAADAMATGQLEQAVAGEGPDEVGRLVGSFNSMSRQVATTARSQRDLLANIAHELRTPLTSVQGYTQALRDGVIDGKPEQERALTTIGREADRMANLIGQLLDLARLESGQMRLTMTPVAVGPLLTRVAERFAPEARHREVAIATTAADGLTVHGDEERLAQILSNLVGNALRHTSSGGEVTMTGTTGMRATPGGAPFVRLTVGDSGEGIAPERLGRIFERFERGEATHEGFGLGLAIVRELAELHGGSVTVESDVGVGTRFMVDLPIAGSS